MRGLIFNYKKALKPDYISSIDTNNIICDCTNFVYKDPYHGHVVTGNLGIVQNTTLRNILKKGPNTGYLGKSIGQGTVKTLLIF